MSLRSKLFISVQMFLPGESLVDYQDRTTAEVGLGSSLVHDLEDKAVMQMPTPKMPNTINIALNES